MKVKNPADALLESNFYDGLLSRNVISCSEEDGETIPCPVITMRNVCSVRRTGNHERELATTGIGRFSKLKLITSNYNIE